MRYVDGLRIPTLLFEAAAWQYSIKVTCACGRSAVFDPHALWHRFQRSRWDETFAKARDRFYCRECWRTKCRKLRPVKFETCREEPTVRLPMPDEREWKRAINRFRG
ncbi:hypothetical protein L284_18760 [Novosphingobium lindaniclasticum LE124]|uniref:Uncharacterized protein n=1 Tax=Novosphingobium lindaniclasticum LE124 TaxID=1096930 RepID=T0IDC3_9SPHN|nr:hypothetical protein L284_18760 [Novosphingobium lindaniclasticum LE124]